MQFSELKDRVRGQWERRSRFNRAVIQPELFEPEIATFGDLESEETWIKALCQFYALNVWDTCTDSYLLITLYFNFKESDWPYEFRHQMLDEFLALPQAEEALKIGFRQLFGTDMEFTPEERNAAYGILELVGGSERRLGDGSDPFEPERKLLQLQPSTP